MSRRAAIRRNVAEIYCITCFQNGGRPPSSLLKVRNFTDRYGSEGQYAPLCLILCRSLKPLRRYRHFSIFQDGVARSVYDSWASCIYCNQFTQQKKMTPTRPGKLSAAAAACRWVFNGGVVVNNNCSWRGSLQWINRHKCMSKSITFKFNNLEANFLCDINAAYKNIVPWICDVI